MELVFDKNSVQNDRIKMVVDNFLKKIPSLEKTRNIPIVIFQDGVNQSYYVKCNISAEEVAKLVDLDAKLKPEDTESFRANRELLLDHKTYLKMKEDSAKGREFNDIIVEYCLDYNPHKPLKVWGGQHRIKAVIVSKGKSNRYHGFKIYFNLNKSQRSEVALISNTNISVSNDTFDRMIEESTFGDTLRKWCQKVGFLTQKDDFPDVGSKAEKITVKQARSFIINFYLGKEKGQNIDKKAIDKHIYEPYLVQTGITIDENYKRILDNSNILKGTSLLKAGRKFLLLHEAQYKAVIRNPKKISKRKAYRNKAFVESILCAWSYVAGLLQSNKSRLGNHYKIPKTNSKVIDPLNAEEMSQYKHDSDPPTYRGLGTRSSLKDRQRMAQVFLAKSLKVNCVLNKRFLKSAVSQVVGLIALNKGYKNV